LLSLVVSVLDLNDIESQKTDITVEPFPVTNFLDDVIATGRSLVVAHKNEFIVERANDLGIIFSDATKLRQCVLNLLSNAGKFTKNGRVTLSIAREKQAARDWIRISVKDTGIGMSPATIERLFKEFNQADASTAGEYGGSGLGLALSQTFCKMLGGSISVESTLGRGSCFTMRVPATTETVHDNTMRTAPAPNRQREIAHAN
jgi:signal transduction histidine kinase